MRKHGMRPTIRPKNTEKCSSNISMDAVGQWLPGDCCSLKSMIGACQEANSAKLFKSDCKLILGMHQHCWSLLVFRRSLLVFILGAHFWFTSESEVLMFRCDSFKVRDAEHQVLTPSDSRIIRSLSVIQLHLTLAASYDFIRFPTRNQKPLLLLEVLTFLALVRLLP